MGYTHYWYIKKSHNGLDRLRFMLFIKSFVDYYNKHLKRNVGLADWNGKGEPYASGDELRFNGVTRDDLSHESCNIYRKDTKETSDKWIFSCCKTARKPYDVAVMVALLMLKLYFPDDVVLGSDGEFFEETEWSSELIKHVHEYVWLRESKRIPIAQFEKFKKEQLNDRKDV